MLDKLCDYGCGEIALYKLKNGKFCCCKSQNICKAIKEKLKKGQKEKYKNGYINPMTGKKRTEEFKKRQSILKKGRPSPKKGCTVSDEAKKKASETVKKKFLNGYVNPMTGKKHSEETKIKQSLIKIGKYVGEKSKTYKVPRTDEVKEKIRNTESGKIITKESILKRKETMIKKGLMIPDDKVSDLKFYYRKVLSFTGKSIKKRFTKEELKKRGIAGKDESYNIDHMFSILEGFKNNIPSYIIGHEYNLQLIHWKENDSKKTKCTISLDDLCSKIFYNEAQ